MKGNITETFSKEKNMAQKKNGNSGKSAAQEDLEQKGYQVVPKAGETAPEEAPEDTSEEKAPENPIASKLSGAVKEVTDEIEQCDKEIEKIDKEKEEKIEKLDKKKEEVIAKKEKLCQQFQEAMSDMQNRFGFQPATPDPEPVKRGRKPSTEGTIRDLVLSYFDKHVRGRTIHIRQFLTAKGRKTNPGVELNRLVKEGVIRNVERGFYEKIK